MISLKFKNKYFLNSNFFSFWIVFASLFCSLEKLQSQTSSPYRLRADSCLAAKATIMSYPRFPQTCEQIGSNSYPYFYTLQILVAKLSVLRGLSASDADSISKIVNIIIPIQDDINRCLTGHWTTSLSVHTFFYLKWHIAKYNLSSPSLIKALSNYEMKIKVLATNLDMENNYKNELQVFSNLNSSIFKDMLLIEAFPEVLSKENIPLRCYKSRYKSSIMAMLHLRFFRGFGEGDAVTYAVRMAEPLKMLAEYVQDPELKNQARVTYQSYIASLSNDYNNGLAVVATERSKGLELDPRRNAVAQMAWLFFGTDKYVYTTIEKSNCSSFMSLPGEIEPDSRLLFNHQSKENKSFNTTEACDNDGTQALEIERKCITPSYVLASSTNKYGGSFNASEAKNNILGWLRTDGSADFVTFCLENGGRSVDGENIWCRYFQNNKTLLATFNVPASETYYKPFLAINKSKFKTYKYIIDKNWLFVHTGTMMYACAIFSDDITNIPSLILDPKSTDPRIPSTWAVQSIYSYFVLEARKGAMILETAELSEIAYTGKNADEQLQAFKNNILASTNGINRWQYTLSSTTTDNTFGNPVIEYNSLSSGSLKMILRNVTGSTDPDKRRQIRYINGIEQTKAYPDSIFNSPYYKQSYNNNTLTIGQFGASNVYNLNWNFNTPPNAVYNNYDVVYPKYTSNSVDIPTISSLLGFLNTGSTLTYQARFINGSSLNMTSPYTPYLIDVPPIDKDTSVIVKWTDVTKNVSTIDTLQLFLVSQPRSTFNKQSRNQFLPNEKPSFSFMGIDKIRKVNRIRIFSQNTENVLDSLTLIDKYDDGDSYEKLKLSSDNRSDTLLLSNEVATSSYSSNKKSYLITGYATNWYNISSSQSFVIYTRNIVVTQPLPNTSVLKANSSNFSTLNINGKFTLPTGARNVSVVIKANNTEIARPNMQANAFVSTVSIPINTDTNTDTLGIIALLNYTDASGILYIDSSIIVKLPVANSVCPLPVLSDILDNNNFPIQTDTHSIINGSDFLFKNNISGGSWFCTDATIGSINISNGYFKALRKGRCAIVYTVKNNCGDSVSVSINVNVLACTLPMPSNILDMDNNVINGIYNVSKDDNIAFKNTVQGGIWSSSSSAIATINSATGLLSVLSDGMFTITYKVFNSCKDTAATSLQINVSRCSAPPMGDITDVSGNKVKYLSLVNGGLTTLTNNNKLGKWASTDISIADIDPLSGKITTKKSGTCKIKYIVETPCGVFNAIIVPLFVKPVRWSFIVQ